MLDLSKGRASGAGARRKGCHMGSFNESIRERESEFTGLKGQVLRYVGTAYALVIVSQFIEALAVKGGDAAGFMYAMSAVVFVFAFVAYPLGGLLGRTDGAC